MDRISRPINRLLHRLLIVLIPAITGYITLIAIAFFFINGQVKNEIASALNLYTTDIMRDLSMAANFIEWEAVHDDRLYELETSENQYEYKAVKNELFTFQLIADNRLDLPVLYITDHSLKIGTISIEAAFPLIYVESVFDTTRMCLK